MTESSVERKMTVQSTLDIYGGGIHKGPFKPDPHKLSKSKKRLLRTLDLYEAGIAPTEPLVGRLAITSDPSSTDKVLRDIKELSRVEFVFRIINPIDPRISNRDDQTVLLPAGKDALAQLREEDATPFRSSSS
jgi:hypothetical protein